MGAAVRGRASGVVVVLAVAISPLLGCFDFLSSDDDVYDDNQFREDVILCEDAVARLQRCCPSFDAKAIECRYHYSSVQGCGSSTISTTVPAFSVDESKCIQQTSCDELFAKDVCKRAVAGGIARTTTMTTPDPGSSAAPSTTVTPPRDAVCP